MEYVSKLSKAAREPSVVMDVIVVILKQAYPFAYYILNTEEIEAYLKNAMYQTALATCIIVIK